MTSAVVSPSMRALAIPTGVAPVDFFRCIAPMKSLADRGHFAGWVNEFTGHSREQQVEMIEEADVVLVSAFAGQFEDRSRPFKNMRGILVYELDDDYWSWPSDPGALDPAHAEITRRAGVEVTPARLAGVESWLRNADLVTTTTPELAEVFRAHGARDVVVCPNAMSPGFVRRSKRRSILKATANESPLMWTRAQRLAEERRVRSNAKRIDKRIAWTGSVAHKADLSPVLQAVRRILSVDGTVGALSLGPGSWVEREEWSGFRPPSYKQLMFRDQAGRTSETVDFANYYLTLEAMAADVAVIPMRESPFNRGKSDVTLLSWAIQEVPVVCSRATGAYAQAERDGFPAVFVDHGDVDGWTAAIRDLLYDPGKALELGQRAKEWVLTRRCFPDAVRPWEEAFERVMRAKGVTPSGAVSRNGAAHG